MKVKAMNFEKQRGIKLYEQVYRKLEDDILEGYLKQGDQLPSIRQAVTMFKVSKTCVEKAYGVLEMNGLIRSISQKGYFVDVDEEHVKLRKKVMEHVDSYEEEIIRYDFRSQSMDKDAFDVTLWKKYLKEVLDHHQEITTYGEARGEQSLRIALSNYAYAMRGVLCNEKNIMVGASFQSLLYILLGLMNRPLVFGMSKETFLPAQMVCEDYQIPIQYFKTDDEGICVDELYQSDVNVLYINSAAAGTYHQPLSKKRQKQLLQWAHDRNAYIIEDDHNGELRYYSKMMPAMQGFDGGKRVLYIGSFSRLLLPALRISYCVLNEELLHKYQQRMRFYTPMSSKIEQLALAYYISDGHLERHVKRLRKHYASKATHMEELLRTYFPNTSIHLEESSLCYILHFEESLDVKSLMDYARNRQIRISISNKGDMVLSFAAIIEDDMKKAIEELYALYLQVIRM
ncbi:MocR-like pyridoxine biosynthesis transcription factor PdxR [Amedibacillus sp. YH-ame10]